jgi:hypothetical protein
VPDDAFVTTVSAAAFTSLQFVKSLPDTWTAMPDLTIALVVTGFNVEETTVTPSLFFNVAVAIMHSFSS